MVPAAPARDYPKRHRRFATSIYLITLPTDGVRGPFLLFAPGNRYSGMKPDRVGCSQVEVVATSIDAGKVFVPEITPTHLSILAACVCMNLVEQDQVGKSAATGIPAGRRLKGSRKNNEKINAHNASNLEVLRGGIDENKGGFGKVDNWTTWGGENLLFRMLVILAIFSTVFRTPIKAAEGTKPSLLDVTKCEERDMYRE